ncbi:MAG: M23 family metallopeptidase [Promicromonosporaceae bacterium]|nr:M23 family metallopeptidase [Promicromonosporaceae bacterium]
MEAFTAAVALWAKRQAVGWLSRHWPKLVAGVIVLASGGVFLGVTAAGLIASSGQVAAASNACTALGYTVDQAAYQPAPLNQAPAIPTGGAVPGFGPNDGDKVANARAIVAAGQSAGVGRRGLIVAIATSLQESGLQNLNHGDRDSLGLFQQRPSQGWGTPQQVQDPTYAALSFFGGRTSPHFNAATGKASPGGLLDVAGWETMPITAAAQAVQRSAFPGDYAKHEARATIIVDALAGGATPPLPTPAAGSSVRPAAPAAQPAALTAADYRAEGVDIASFCSANFQLASTTTSSAASLGSDRVIPAAAWTAPLQSAVTSPFGMRFHPIYHQWRLHAGTDFHAVVGTPIVAPTVGVVESVTWDSGGGLMVMLKHAGGVETLHLHLSKALVKPGDTVQGGQVIALSGDSGVGTGAHYHFEIHVNGEPVDPEPFMLQHGVNLRAWS